MSTSIKDKIVAILKEIISSARDKNLLLSDLQDLLLELQNITVFDGIELFISYINNESPSDAKKINVFMFRFLEDLSMFPKVYSYLQERSSELRPLVAELQAQEKESEVEEAINLKSLAQESIKADMSEDEAEPLFEDKGSGSHADLDKRLDDLYDDSIENNRKSKPSPKPPSAPAAAPMARSEAMPPPPAPAPGGVSMSKPQASRSISAKSSEKEFAPDERMIESKKKKSKASKKSDKSEFKDVLEELSEEEGFIETGKRGVLVDYFSRMNINQVYDFTVKIDKEMLKAKKKQSDLLTGEQREQLTDEITVVEEKAIEIELQIPGCLVTPSSHYVSTEPSEITFYVTPYVKFSKKIGKLVIGQDKLNRKTINFDVSVIDRRIMKIFSLVGILIASIPSIWPVLFGVDLNGYIVTNASYYMSFVTNTTILPIEVGLGGLITLFSLLMFKRYSSKRTQFTSTQPI